MDKNQPHFSKENDVEQCMCTTYHSYYGNSSPPKLYQAEQPKKLFEKKAILFQF